MLFACGFNAIWMNSKTSDGYGSNICRLGLIGSTIFGLGLGLGLKKPKIPNISIVSLQVKKKFIRSVQKVPG